jgi:hypothetical protein
VLLAGARLLLAFTDHLLEEKQPAQFPPYGAGRVGRPSTAVGWEIWIGRSLRYRRSVPVTTMTLRLPHREQTEPLAPLEDGRIGAIPLGHLCRVGPASDITATNDEV